jgi:hypothetical protein
MVKLNKETISQLEDLLNDTGFEIWNASGSYRLSVSPADDGFRVCTHDDPLHPEKVYKDLNRALAFLQKKDEE